jgi:hypothetical protein
MCTSLVDAAHELHQMPRMLAGSVTLLLSAAWLTCLHGRCFCHRCFVDVSRGALFFGPGFRVTRNKLTFRDNLALLLEAASPVDRALERHFREWLTACHRSYDRSVKFEVLCHPAAQVRTAGLMSCSCLPMLSKVLCCL